MWIAEEEIKTKTLLGSVLLKSKDVIQFSNMPGNDLRLLANLDVQTYLKMPDLDYPMSMWTNVDLHELSFKANEELLERQRKVDERLSTTRLHDPMKFQEMSESETSCLEMLWISDNLLQGKLSNVSYLLV